MKIFVATLLLILALLKKSACNDEADSYDFTTHFSTPFTWVVAPNIGPKGVSSITFTKKFNESCSIKTDCKSGYSECIDKMCGCVEEFKNDSWHYCPHCQKVCQCLDGFDPDENGICKPKSYKCPGINGTDVLLIEAKKAKRCLVKNVKGEFFDDCNSKSQFCFVHKAEQTQKGDRIGHCCLKLEPSQPFTSTCPIGESLDYNCKALVQKKEKSNRWDSQACQSQTGSYCTKWTVEGTNETLLAPTKGLDCCRLPCEYPDKYYYVNGMCYLYSPWPEKNKEKKRHKPKNQQRQQTFVSQEKNDKTNSDQSEKTTM